MGMNNRAPIRKDASIAGKRAILVLTQFAKQVLPKYGKGRLHRTSFDDKEGQSLVAKGVEKGEKQMAQSKGTLIREKPKRTSPKYRATIGHVEMDSASTMAIVATATMGRKATKIRVMEITQRSQACP
jgi:hypothetical protein